MAPPQATPLPWQAAGGLRVLGSLGGGGRGAAHPILLLSSAISSMKSSKGVAAPWYSKKPKLIEVIPPGGDCQPGTESFQCNTGRSWPLSQIRDSLLGVSKKNSMQYHCLAAMTAVRSESPVSPPGPPGLNRTQFSPSLSMCPPIRKSIPPPLGDTITQWSSDPGFSLGSRSNQKKRR